MWDSDAQKLAIKAIATVESNLKYDAINYNDAITVGIAQWYGTRAANLLNQIRSTPAWVGVAQSLTDDLANNAETNARYWTKRFLTRAEGSSLKPVLTSDTGVQVQNAQTVDDLNDYKIVADRAGLDANTNTNAFIFWCVMYHQGPRYAGQVLSAAGDNPTLDRLYTIALNHHWFKDYKTRFSTARTIILSGDNSGIPDFGVPTSPDEEGGDLGTDSPIDTPPPLASGSDPGDVRHVMAVGDAIHVVMKDGSVTVCYPTSNGHSWVPGVQSTATPEIAPTTPEPSPTTPPSGGTTATQDALAAFLLARVGAYDYSQGPGRHTPDTSGYTDCSGLVRYAYKKVAGIEVGTYTVDQQNYGTRIWANVPGNSSGASKYDVPALSILQKGDLVFFSDDSSYTRVRHVEMYLGDGRLIGHGVPGVRGPTIKASATGYMGTWNWIIVRRYL